MHKHESGAIDRALQAAGAAYYNVPSGKSECLDVQIQLHMGSMGRQPFYPDGNCPLTGPILVQVSMGNALGQNETRSAGRPSHVQTLDIYNPRRFVNFNWEGWGGVSGFYDSKRGFLRFRCRSASDALSFRLFSGGRSSSSGAPCKEFVLDNWARTAQYYAERPPTYARLGCLGCAPKYMGTSTGLMVQTEYTTQHEYDTSTYAKLQLFIAVIPEGAPLSAQARKMNAAVGTGVAAAVLALLAVAFVCYRRRRRRSDGLLFPLFNSPIGATTPPPPPAAAAGAGAGAAGAAVPPPWQVFSAAQPQQQPQQRQEPPAAVSGGADSGRRRPPPPPYSSVVAAATAPQAAEAAAAATGGDYPVPPVQSDWDVYSRPPPVAPGCDVPRVATKKKKKKQQQQQQPQTAPPQEAAAAAAPTAVPMAMPTAEAVLVWGNSYRGGALAEARVLRADSRGANDDAAGNGAGAGAGVDEKGPNGTRG